MTKTTLYVSIRVSPSSGYVSIENACRSKKELKEKYQRKKKMYLEHSHDIESFEDFKEDYLKVEITYDGRKNEIPEEKVLRELEERGILKKIGKGGTLGGYYKLASENSITDGLVF